MDFIQGFLGAIVGAFASLAGVVISQRGQRKIAHDGRIWEHRLGCYAVVLDYIESLRRWIDSSEIDPRSGRRTLTSPPEPPSGLRGQMIYATDAVQRAFDELSEYLSRCDQLDPDEAVRDWRNLDMTSESLIYMAIRALGEKVRREVRSG